MTLQRAPRSFLLVSLLTTSALACSGDGATGAASASASTPAPRASALSASSAAASSAAATSAARASASATSKPVASAVAPTTDQKKKLLQHLGEGRRLSKKKEYDAALKELDAALVASPNDPRVLAEIGWAAFGKRDLERARSSTTLALAHTSDAKQRAQILYTRGRAHQEGGDKDAAKRDYAESLTLRDNAEVAKRYAEVGGKAEEIIPPWSVCTEGYATVAELCGCLEKKGDSLLFLEGKTTCEAGPRLDLGDPRLSVVRVSRGDIGYDAALILVAEDDKKLRAVAQVGHEFEPGAFGVHNTAEVKGGKLTSKGAIVAVRHVQSNVDSNMAGLELCEEHTVSDTLCVLGKGGSPTTCPRTIPIESTSGCGLGVEVDPADLGPDGDEEIKRIKASASKKTTKLEWSIDDGGKLTVKVTEGDRASVPAALLSEALLLPSR